MRRRARRLPLKVTGELGDLFLDTASRAWHNELMTESYPTSLDPDKPLSHIDDYQILPDHLKVEIQSIVTQLSRIIHNSPILPELEEIAHDRLRAYFFLKDMIYQELD